jgi:hypothetical protein
MKGLRFMQVGVCLGMSLFLVASNLHDSSENLLFQSLQEMGFTLEHYVLHHGGRTTQPMTSGEIEQWVEHLRQALQSSPVRRQMHAQEIYYTTGKEITQSLRITLKVVNDKPSQQRNCPYISLQLTSNGIPDPAVRRQITELLRSHGIIPHFHTSIQGSKPLFATSLEEPIMAIFQRLQAQEVEAMRTDRTVSVSAYSPLLQERLPTAGGVMNLQAATRINQDAHRLMLTIGVPIITIEY